MPRHTADEQAENRYTRQGRQPSNQAPSHAIRSGSSALRGRRVARWASVHPQEAGEMVVVERYIQTSGVDEVARLRGVIARRR